MTYVEEFLDRIVNNLTAFLEVPRVEQKEWDRTGWIHCSDLSEKYFDAEKCVATYLGLPYDRKWDTESALKIACGSAIDTMFDHALLATGIVKQTQVDLKDEALRLSGTPDFLWVDEDGTEIIGDVKSTGGWTFDKHYANPEWDISNAYFLRQLQAYLYLTNTDEAMVLVVDRDILTVPTKTVKGPYDKTDLRDYLYVRWLYRDEACINGILSDVQRVLEMVEERRVA